MRADLTLDHLALFRGMHELDRVLEADDIEVAVLIEVVDHRRQRRRFAGTGATRHQHHALVIIAELLEDRRHVQLVEGRHITRDKPEDGAHARGLAEYVDAEATALVADVREVEIVTCVQTLLLFVRQDFEQIGFEFGIAQLAELDRAQVAVHAQHRRHADRQVDVGAALREPEFQECVDACHSWSYSVTVSSASVSSSIDW